MVAGQSGRAQRGHPLKLLDKVEPAGAQPSARMNAYLAKADIETPCLIVDLDAIEANYRALRRHLPIAHLFYAVKANPAREILARLAGLGASFDAASPAEIDLCLSVGADASRISYGNTIKKSQAIAYAYARGVRLYAFDSAAELEKLAVQAPGAQVFCRVLMSGAGADWPLGRKFGCSGAMALDLLERAKEIGLDPVGISFHVGSQQTDLKQWDIAIATVARLFGEAAARGLSLNLINLGGGFPAQYRAAVPTLSTCAGAVMRALMRHFGTDLPKVVMEPGRSLVADAGVIAAEVVLVARKDEKDPKRWVYLDIGKFSGLAETMDELVKYRIRTRDDGGPAGPVVLAGPTCDSADILYEKAGYELPLSLSEGDRVEILSAGAYTSSYASVGFNGFAPLKVRCI